MPDLTPNETFVLMLALKADGDLPYDEVYRAVGGERAWHILNSLKKDGALDHPGYNRWRITEKGRIAAALLLAKDEKLESFVFPDRDNILPIPGLPYVDPRQPGATPEPIGARSSITTHKDVSPAARQAFEQWMTNTAKIALGSPDQYPAALERDAWHVWQAAWGAKPK